MTTLAYLAASYEDRTLLPSEKAESQNKSYIVKVTKGNTPKVTKVKVAKEHKVNNIIQKAVFVQGPKSNPLPEKGTLSAEQFLLTIRKVTDRNETIKAIAGYVGYDNTLSFGAQESSARMQAKREMNPVIAASKPYRSGCNVSGFVAGVPDHIARKKADLEARERHATNEMLFHDKEGRVALAAKYRGSITAIRKELSNL